MRLPYARERSSGGSGGDGYDSARESICQSKQPRVPPPLDAASLGRLSNRNDITDPVDLVPSVGS